MDRKEVIDMTNEEFKKRCLSMGCKEDKIDKMINFVGLFGPTNYCGELFGPMCEDTKEFREIVDDWGHGDGSVVLFELITAHRDAHPDYYKEYDEFIKKAKKERNFNLDDLYF